MSNAEIIKLLKQGIAGHDLDGSLSNGISVQPAGHESTAAPVVESALSHVMALNAASLEYVLSEAAVEMTRPSFLQLVVMPLFERIGDLWRTGKMKIINEHMASLVVRSILWDMLRSVNVSNAAPRIVVATPVGHWHEFGALASALAASESGWRVAYFGPNLPSEEMAYAVKRLDAKALALSLCHLLNDSRLLSELNKLRRLVGHEVPIFIGGPGAGAVRKVVVHIDAIVGIDLNEFRRRLEKLAQNE
jgi:methanogenic corrinoid protein MtbC1